MAAKKSRRSAPAPAAPEEAAPAPAAAAAAAAQPDHHAASSPAPEESHHGTDDADDAAPPPSSSKKRKPSAAPELEVDLALPEPPSKKARRALKKGKPLPAKPASSDDEDGGGGGGGEAAPARKAKKERSPHGVWIGNLRFSVTKADLRRWLVDNAGGAIADDDITRVHLPAGAGKGAPAAAKAAGEAREPAGNRGFAYVDFASQAGQVAAIALSETEWHGRRLLIKSSTSFEGRPKKEPAAAAPAGEGSADGPAAGAGGKPPSRKVFVGNLGFATVEDDLWRLFGRCGEIDWVKVATFEDSGKCKGYGWVQFRDPEGAASAARGFVKVKEEVETEDDFVGEGDETAAAGGEEGGESGEEQEEEEEEEGKKARRAGGRPAGREQKKTRTKKWWVNMLQGRKLKVEFAEDDQVRYSKRFGKGAKRSRDAAAAAAGPPAGGAAGGGGGGDDDAAAGGKPAARPARPAKKEPKFRQDVNVARLTGGMVEHQGKKTTFD